MTAKNDAATALEEQIDASIHQIQRDRGNARCPAHESVALGLVTLLRCEKARLAAPAPAIPWSQLMVAAGVAGAFVAGVVETVTRLTK